MPDAAAAGPASGLAPGHGADLPRALSLRARLLWWLIPAMLVLQVGYGALAYVRALHSANLAYDRTLLVSARNIADGIVLTAGGIQLNAPYISLDSFEIGLNATMYYRVTGMNGEFIAGFKDLPPFDPSRPRTDLYPALVSFYDDTYRGQPVRIAALRQAVVDHDGLQGGMVLVEVGETIGSRRALTGKIFREVITGQALLIFAVAAVIFFFTRRALAPLNALGEEMAGREPGDTTPLPLAAAPAEAVPMVAALNCYMVRFQAMLSTQRRFIADAAHQLRTPIAVLHTQAQLVAREEQPERMRAIAHEIADRSARMVALAEKLISSARVAYGAASEPGPCNLGELVREVCLEFMPEARARGIDLGFEGEGPVVIRANELLQELVRNLVDNALRYTPRGGVVTARVRRDGPRALLEVEDNGPGIAPEERAGVLEPFHRGAASALAAGSGLGLAIVRDVAAQHRAELELLDGQDGGLLVRVSFAGAGETLRGEGTAR